MSFPETQRSIKQAETKERRSNEVKNNPKGFIGDNSRLEFQFSTSNYQPYIGDICCTSAEEAKTKNSSKLATKINIQTLETSTMDQLNQNVLAEYGYHQIKPGLITNSIHWQKGLDASSRKHRQNHNIKNNRKELYGMLSAIESRRNRKNEKIEKEMTEGKKISQERTKYDTNHIDISKSWYSKATERICSWKIGGYRCIFRSLKGKIAAKWQAYVNFKLFCRRKDAQKLAQERKYQAKQKLIATKARFNHKFNHFSKFKAHKLITKDTFLNDCMKEEDLFHESRGKELFIIGKKAVQYESSELLAFIASSFVKHTNDLCLKSIDDINTSILHDCENEIGIYPISEIGLNLETYCNNSNGILLVIGHIWFLLH